MSCAGCGQVFVGEIAYCGPCGDLARRDFLTETHTPDIIMAKTPQKLADLRAWGKAMPGERSPHPPHTRPPMY